MTAAAAWVFGLASTGLVQAGPIRGVMKIVARAARTCAGLVLAIGSAIVRATRGDFQPGAGRRRVLLDPVVQPFCLSPRPVTTP